MLESGGEGFDLVLANETISRKVSSVENNVPLPPTPPALSLSLPLLQPTQQTTKSHYRTHNRAFIHSITPPYRRTHVSGNRCGVNPAGGLRDSSHALTALVQPQRDFQSTIDDIHLSTAPQRHYYY